MFAKKGQQINISAGLDFLGISDLETINYIKDSLVSNYYWTKEQIKIKEDKENYLNRFTIPKGKDKQFYKELLKDTQSKIDFWKNKFRDNPDNIFYDLEREDYSLKKVKLKALLTHHKSFGDDLSKAKAYPLENLLEFNPAGFVSCPFHGPEKTPSCKLYKKDNHVYCFGCGKKADSIDVYMIINNVDMKTAIWKMNK